MQAHFTLIGLIYLTGTPPSVGKHARMKGKVDRSRETHTEHQRDAERSEKSRKIQEGLD